MPARRSFFKGMIGLGAGAAANAVLPKAAVVKEQPAVADVPKPEAPQSGYQLEQQAAALGLHNTYIYSGPRVPPDMLVDGKLYYLRTDESFLLLDGERVETTD